ncbi:CoA-binding protein [Microaerobacter geothermalis]|uniref:CoA-binding protein n=1 Tax=Microaerobacter geothermalis TaxID=674972 RepID=UPI001F488D37|nr:CoA-binding protein [Microaerobacter geothermalis]MCF6094848.1 CoA-binding protein [Microaerobacter geothermalis]
MMNYLLSPSSLAVIGGTNNHQKKGGRVLINLQKSKFPGRLYAVNPNHKEVFGVPCYSSILDIPDEVEAACIIIPAPEIPEVIRECVRKGVKMVSIFSSGFAETGDEGERLQREILSIIKGTNLHVYGPNIPGLFDFRKKWGLSFSPKFEPHRFFSGSIGVITQGGSLGRAIIDANEKGIGFSYWFSPGNEIDLDTNDFLKWLVDDDHTDVILMILESVPDPERFIEVVNEASNRNKPIVVLKLGNSPLAIKAIEKHLGINRNRHLSWSLYKHPGIIQVDDLDELIGVGWLLQKYNQVMNGRVLIYSWAGGSSILMTDMCERYGVSLPPMTRSLREKFEALTPQNRSIMNPLDLTTAVYENLSLFNKGLRLAIDSGEYDIILIPIPFKIENLTEQMALHIIDLAKNTKVPLVPVFLTTGELSGTTYEMIANSGIPYFTKTETAIKSLALFLRYKQMPNILRGGNYYEKINYTRGSG